MTKSACAMRRWVVMALVQLALLMSPALAGAQERPEPKPEPKPAPEVAAAPEAMHVNPPGWVTEVFALKFAQPNDLVGVLRMFSGRANYERDLKVVMWSGPKELAPAVEDVIKRLDVAPTPVPGIELTFYLLSGSKQGGTGAAPVPELGGVATQVQKLFGLSRLSLLETAVLRTRDGSQGRTEGVIPTEGDPGHPTYYSLAFDRALLSGDERGKVVSLSRLWLRLNVPKGPGSSPGPVYNESNLRTDVDVREGQKVVVGKASVGASGDTLFLVVTAKAVD